MSPRLQKLTVDFVAMTRLRVVMDEDARDLVDLLCTRVGMIMEDASYLALTVGAVDQDLRAERLAQLANASARIDALIQAALAIET